MSGFPIDCSYFFCLHSHRSYSRTHSPDFLLSKWMISKCWYFQSHYLACPTHTYSKKMVFPLICFVSPLYCFILHGWPPCHPSTSVNLLFFSSEKKTPRKLPTGTHIIISDMQVKVFNQQKYAVATKHSFSLDPDLEVLIFLLYSLYIWKSAFVPTENLNLSFILIWNCLLRFQ